MATTLNDCPHGTIVEFNGTTYRLYRLEQLAGGVLGTMKRFASLQPCQQRDDGHWWEDHQARRLIRNWSEECRIVDASKTAAAGEVFDTRSPVKTESTEHEQDHSDRLR